MKINFCSASCSLLITCDLHSLIKFRQLEQFKHNRFRKSESFALYVIFFRSALHRSLSSLASQLCRALFRTFPNSFDCAHFFRSKFDGSYVRGILQLREKKQRKWMEVFQTRFNGGCGRWRRCRSLGCSWLSHSAAPFDHRRVDFNEIAIIIEIVWNYRSTEEKVN